MLLLLMSVDLLGQQADTRAHIKDVETPSQNRFYPRTQLMSYAKAEEALTGDYSQSDYYQNLDGQWQFKYFASARDLGSEHTDREFDDSAWQAITVPMNLEMAGVKGARYADSTYVFDFNKQSMELSSLGSAAVYRRKFKIPYLWEERQIFLHLGALGSASVVYINGKQVGFGKDSKSPTEFDVTKFVEEGYNTLVIENYEYSSASLLEASDNWLMSGLSRSVYMYTQPKVSIRDFTVRTTLNPELTDGLLELGVITKSYYLNPKSVKVFYDLYNPDGKRISYENRSARLRMRLEDTVYFAISVPEVKKWSAETPDLYTLVMRVQRENRFTEAVSFKVGFREVDYSTGNLIVNGSPVTIKGVVYGEHNRYTGSVLSRSQIKNDLLDMKDLGFNAVRTEHPMGRDFYELTDSIGLYVCDVANISPKPMGRSLSRGGALSNNKIFRDDHIERVLSASQNSRNYPSVIMLLMGTNGGNGYNFYKAYQAVKQVDMIRPIAYSGAGLEWNSDLYAIENPSLEQISELETTERDRPHVFTQMAIDNDLIPSWQTILASGGVLQGGFINSWQTRSLPSATGEWVPGDDKQQAIVDADGSLSPLAGELKELFYPIKVSLDGSDVTIENRFDFIDLSTYIIECSAKEGDKVISSGSIRIDAMPHSTASGSVSDILLKGGDELDISILTPDSTQQIYRTTINLK